MEKDYESKIFVKKKKQKYPRNRFFSYSGENRDDKNFNYKDFRNSNSIHSSFKRCEFWGTLFKKSKLKYCSFSGAKFTGITFINCNFTGSRFLGATFDNCVFDNCIFKKCKFKNTKFFNTYVKNSSFKESNGLELDINKYKIQDIKNVDDLILDKLKREYENTNLSIFINRINISRLLAAYELEIIEKAFRILKENEKIKEVTFSHVLTKI